MNRKPVPAGEGNAEDELTRTRLIEAAGPLFASEGFHGARVRDICARAGANIAAVNYHFGDKLGLYKAVLRCSVHVAPLDSVYEAKTGVKKLYAFIRMILESLVNTSRQSWYINLISQEMGHPSPAFDQLVAEFIRPRYKILCELIGGMVGQPPKSRIVQLCAHSVVGQARHYLIAKAVVEKVWPEFRLDKGEIDELADHITAFSLAGIRACGRAKKQARHSSHKGAA